MFACIYICIGFDRLILYDFKSLERFSLESSTLKLVKHLFAENIESRINELLLPI